MKERLTSTAETQSSYARNHPSCSCRSTFLVTLPVDPTLPIIRDARIVQIPCSKLDEAVLGRDGNYDLTEVVWVVFCVSCFPFTFK